MMIYAWNLELFNNVQPWRDEQFYRIKIKLYMSSQLASLPVYPMSMSWDCTLYVEIRCVDRCSILLLHWISRYLKLLLPTGVQIRRQVPTRNRFSSCIFKTQKAKSRVAHRRRYAARTAHRRVSLEGGWGGVSSPLHSVKVTMACTFTRRKAACENPAETPGTCDSESEVNILPLLWFRRFCANRTSSPRQTFF